MTLKIMGSQITAIPKLLEVLVLKRCLVTIDTMGCQRVEEDFGHGRIEERKCTLYHDLSFINNASAWKNLTAIVKIEAKRYIKSSGKEEKEIRLYITSSKENAEVIGRGVRSHWGIENNLHWQLDVSFNEDESRKREGYAVQNFSTLNRIALNLIKHEQSKKRSIKGKRLDAGWDNDYFMENPQTGDRASLRAKDGRYRAEELETGKVLIHSVFTRIPAVGNWLVLRHSARDHAGTFVIDSKMCNSKITTCITISGLVFCRNSPKILALRM
jgi:predicted transposase YbfD/YdcC